MKIKKLGFILTLFLVACTPEEKTTVDPPEDLIPHTEMVPLMIDLQIIESHYQKRYQRANMYKEALDSASMIVFDKHNVTKDQYERSYGFYAMDLQGMFLLLETTLDSINYRVNQNTEQ